MSVRKRTWTTAKGEKKEAWIVDYVDHDGDRHIETFKRKKEADAFHAQVGVDVRAGTYTAPSKSITVKEAAEDWIKSVALEGREVSPWRNTGSMPSTSIVVSVTSSSPN